jgi:hypothetical protein
MNLPIFLSYALANNKTLMINEIASELESREDVDKGYS